MFETFTLLELQQYWWMIISLLASALVFMMFVQGGQTLIYTLGKTESERNILVNALGRKWELTFTTLVTFGGAFFAAFPLFYATSFGGAYWLWMAILFAFIIQAISYEYRSKPNNVLGKRTFEYFLFINGILGTILLGIVVGTFFNGAPFSINAFNQSQWESSLRGIEAIANWHNLILGLTILFLARTLAILYFMNHVDNAEIILRCKKHLRINALPFVVLFLIFLIKLILSDGYNYETESGFVYLEKYKYLINLTEMPFVLMLLAISIVSVLWGIIRSIISDYSYGIWFTGFGTVGVVFSLFCLAGLNHTSYYPSTFEFQSSLTIENSSSSKYTLTALSYVSLFVPVVILYIFFAWRSINKKKICQKDLEENSHVY